VTPAETVSLWQSLGFGPNYKAAYCMAVCPAGEDVVAAYRANKAAHTKQFLRPLQQKVEPVYVIPGSDAEAYAKKRYPHKRPRLIRSSLHAGSVASFGRGAVLTFQREASAGLNATFHFIFSGVESGETTIVIREKTIRAEPGLIGQADVTVRADGKTWLRFIRGEASLLPALLFRRIRISGSPSLLLAFGRCFPK
jgi:hypothetical protein